MKRAILTALVLLGGCANLPYPQGRGDFDSRLDRAEANAFCARWNAVKNESTPAAAKARAELAAEPLPLGVQDQLRCGKPSEIFAQGLDDVRRLAKGAPEDPSVLRLLSDYQQSTGDARGAAASSCRAAELAGRDPIDWEECGDLRLTIGDVPGALTAWKAAVIASADRDQQFAIIEKIEGTSNQPSVELAALPPEVLQQYRRWVQEQQLPRAFAPVP